MYEHYRPVGLKTKHDPAFNCPASLTIAFLVCLLLWSAYVYIENRTHHPVIEKLSWKYNHLVTTQENYDVIIIGTSRLARGVDTAFVNMNQHEDCPLSFFNAGLPLMNPAEFKVFLKAIKDNPHLTPKYIVFHPIFGTPLKMIKSERNRWSNKIEQLPLNLQFIKTMPDGGQNFKEYFKNLVISQLKIGSALSRINYSPGPYDEFYHNHMAENAGFVSLNEDPPIEKSKRHENFLKHSSRWKEKIRASQGHAHSYSAKPPAPAMLALHKKIVSLAGSTGAIPVAVFQPHKTYFGDLISLYRSILPANHVLDFNLHDYPDYSNIDLWYDEGHFNKAGAQKFAMDIYEEICRLEKDK